MQIALSWPPAPLRPNARPDRWTKARAVKTYRSEAWASTLAQPLTERAALRGATKIRVHWTFHPMTRNLPDGSNALAATKAAEDGIADALGVNDRIFVHSYEIAEPVKGGAVVVEVSLP